MLVFVIQISAIIFVITIFALEILYKVSFSYWEKRNVRSWKPTIPFGNAKEIILQKEQFGFDTVHLYNYLKSKSLKYGGYYMLTEPVFVPVDIVLIKKMFIRDFKYFSDRIAHVDEDNDPLSANLVHLAKDRWKVIRPTIMSFISSKNINETFPLLKQCALTLANVIEDYIKNEECIDLKVLVDGFIIDLIGAFFLKINCDAQINPDGAFKTQKTRSSVENYFERLLSNKIPVKESEILGNVSILFLAGYDTSSGSITFCLYELATNQKLQDAVRLEVNSVFERHGGEYTYSSVEECSLLEQCVKETLRKYPMCTVVTRICTRDYPVPDSDLIVKKSTHVYMPIRAVHWDDEFYPNPEVFDPNRFTEENRAKRPPCSWIPYGAGTRRCVAHKLASISVKLCLAVLLRHFKFDLDSSSLGPMEYNPKSYILQSKKTICFVVNKTQI